MPGPQPPAVPLAEEERQALHTMIRAHKTLQPSELPGTDDPLGGGWPSCPRRGTPPRHDTHHGPALASPLGQAPWGDRA